MVWPLALLLLAGCASEGEVPSPQVPPAPAIHFGVVPGEFEPVEALILSLAQLVEFHPQVLVDIARAVPEGVRLIGLTDLDAEARLAQTILTEAGLPTEQLELLPVAVQSMWLRDYGPLFARDRAGRLVAVDTHYRGTSNNPIDDDVPVQLAAALDIPLHKLPLTLEGGNLLSNGRGFLLSSSWTLELNAREGVDRAAVDGLMNEVLFMRGRAWLSPLAGEPTRHIDMYATWIDPTTLVLADYDSGDNASRLDQIAAALVGTQLGVGELKIERIQQPSHEDGRFRTYTNVIFAGDRLLVPQYPDVAPELDAEALASYRRWLPNHEIVGIDSRSLIERNGSLHCISIALPRR